MKPIFEKPQAFACDHIGVDMRDQPMVSRVCNCDGTLYWKATQPIGSICGSEVNGELVGIGRTKEQALQRLQEEVRKLADSIWG